MKYDFEKTMDPFFTTHPDLVEKKLSLLNLKDGETLVDLGCGDANCLIMALELAKVNAIGYELRPEALKAAEENILKNKAGQQVEVKEEDFYLADLSKVDAVILYLTRTALGSLSLKLEKELPVGARIVTHEFDIPAWKAKKEDVFLTKAGLPIPIYLYEKE